MLDVVSRTAEQVFMPLTVGGGVRTIDDVRALLGPDLTRFRSILRRVKTQSLSRKPRNGSAVSVS